MPPVVSIVGKSKSGKTTLMEKLVRELIDEHQDIADQIRNGKESAVGFLIGQAMKKTQGKANPKKIGELIKKALV